MEKIKTIPGWVLIGILILLFVGMLIIFPPPSGRKYTYTSPTSDSIQANPEDLIATVNDFYTNISSKKIESAWNLLSENFKNNSSSYDYFANGYNTTENVNIKNIQVSDEFNNIVYVELEATDDINGKTVKKNYNGTWQLVQENGSWKLDTPNIFLANSSSEYATPQPQPSKTSPSHDGTRTGKIITYHELCTNKDIQVYENELLPKEKDGKTVYMTKDDWECAERNKKPANNSSQASNVSTPSQNNIPQISQPQHDEEYYAAQALSYYRKCLKVVEYMSSPQGACPTEDILHQRSYNQCVQDSLNFCNDSLANGWFIAPYAWAISTPWCPPGSAGDCIMADTSD